MKRKLIIIALLAITISAGFALIGFKAIMELIKEIYYRGVDPDGF